MLKLTTKQDLYSPIMRWRAAVTLFWCAAVIVAEKLVPQSAFYLMIVVVVFRGFLLGGDWPLDLSGAAAGTIFACAWFEPIFSFSWIAKSPLGFLMFLSFIPLMAVIGFFAGRSVTKSFAPRPGLRVNE